MLGPLEYSDAALRCYGHADLLSVAAAINGDDFVPFNEAIFIKEPGLGASVAWHQDGITHWDSPDWDEGSHGFNFMVQLYGCTPANGVWVVPGSHKHGRVDIKDRVKKNGSERLPEAVPIVCEPGDVAISNRQILHGSFANTSPNWRVTLNMGFHRRRSVFGVSGGGLHAAPAVYDDAHIEKRSRVIGYAIDARSRRYPDEKPYAYRPHVEAGATHVYDDAARDWMHDYNLLRDYLCEHGLIKTLDAERFEPRLEGLLPEFDRLSQWARDRDDNVIGVCQRFGTFNLVVNTDKVDRTTAEDLGFALATENARPYGLLRYDDFNIFHVCIGAGLDPFKRLKPDQLDAFSQTARSWIGNAKIVTDDHLALNRALVDGDIDFYISGGVYTVSPARAQGHLNLRAITPRQGPIGKEQHGAIVFTEITSVLDHPGVSPHAEDFLEYICTPEVAHRMAMQPATLNPVAQMGDQRTFRLFSSEDLQAIQWDSLAEDIARCAMYQIPPDNDELRERLDHEYSVTKNKNV